MPCSIATHKFHDRFVKRQTPAILQNCVNVCPERLWDFVSHIVPSEQGRGWYIADGISGKFEGVF